MVFWNVEAVSQITWCHIPGNMLHEVFLFFFFKGPNQSCPVHQEHHITRKMVVAHPIMRKVEVKLRSVTLKHQLNKLRAKHVLHIDRERLVGEHQRLDMYVLLLLL